MTRLLYGLAGALLALLTAITLVALPGTSAGAATPADQPKVGQCRALTYGQMQKTSDPSATVACGATHTAYTFAVPTFPNGTDLATETTANLVKAADTACTQAAVPYFRGSHVHKDMALWGTAYFIPTTAQLAAGQNWIECDIVVVWPGKKLMPMPTIRKPLYGATEPKVALACHTGSSAVVPCTTKHQWHPVGGFNFKHSGGYPSKAAFLAAGKRCHTVTKTERYLVSWPLKSAWKQGDHAIICSKPSTT